MATATTAAAAAAAAASQLAPYTSLWSSVAEWFTPTVFFVLLNVVIGTIAVTSKSLSHHAHSAKQAADHQHQHLYGADQHVQYHDAAPPPPTRQLSRTGSMLQRLKSFNLNFHMYRGYHRPEDYGLVSAPAADVPEPHEAHGGGVGMEAASVPKETQQQVVVRQKPAKKSTKPRRRDPSPPRHQLLPSQDQHQHHLPEEEPQANGAASDAAEFETLEEAFLAASGGSSCNAHLNRIQSDTLPTAGERPRKLAATMKKSASTKSAFAHFEARDLPRRPATTRDDRHRNLLDPADVEDDDSSSNEEYGDAEFLADDQPRPKAEVDERAGDFINRFRQQLKLQRLESLMRYRDMLNRGR